MLKFTQFKSMPVYRRTVFFIKLTAKRRAFDSIPSWREERNEKQALEYTHTQYFFRGNRATAIKIECTHAFDPPITFLEIECTYMLKQVCKIYKIFVIRLVFKNKNKITKLNHSGRGWINYGTSIPWNSMYL